MTYPLINDKTEFDAVVLAAGDFPTHKTPLGILRQTNRLIVCDSALEEVVSYNKDKDVLKPLAVIGDGDSLSSELKKQYASIWHCVSEQDDNDLTKSTRYAIEHYQPKNIAYIGATGKREDHTLGNVSLMVEYFENLNLQPNMITDYGWFVPASGDNTFASFKGQQVSIFNVDCTKLEGDGLKWAPYSFKRLWQGTLNESEGDEFTINGNGTYLIFRTFDKKTYSK